MRSAMYRLGTRVLTLIGQLTLFLGASYLLLYKNPTAFRLTAWPPLSPLEVLPSPRILARALRQLVWRYGAHPLWRETAGYIWHTLTFQFGTSLTYPAVPLWHKVLSAMPITLELVLTSAILGLVLGVLLGLVAALRAHTWIDRLLGGLAHVGRGVPSFVIAAGAIWFFGALLPGLLPVHGWEPPSTAILPIGILFLANFAAVFHRFRGGFQEAMRQDYMMTARAKGLRQGAQVLRHGLVNAGMDLLRVAGPMLALTVVNAVWVENLFVVPGMGILTATGVANVDGPLMMTSLFLLVLLAMALKTAVNLTYWLVDPRRRRERVPLLGRSNQA